MATLATILMTAQAAGIGIGTIKKLFDYYARGKGTSPFGEPGRFEQYPEDTPEEVKFKEEIRPDVHKLLKDQLTALKQPYKSPYERLSESPMAPFLGAMAPQMLQDMSGDPEAGAGEWLNPLITSLAYQNIPSMAKWAEGYMQPQQSWQDKLQSFIQQRQGQQSVDPQIAQQQAQQAIAQQQQVQQQPTYPQVSPEGLQEQFSQQQGITPEQQAIQEARIRSAQYGRANQERYEEMGSGSRPRSDFF